LSYAMLPCPIKVKPSSIPSSRLLVFLFNLEIVKKTESNMMSLVCVNK
jgi:hypothetical protein